jgi:hypothetical protein
MTRWSERWKSLAKTALAAVVGIVAVIALYLVLLCHPGMFFRHTFTLGVITLYSDEPIPPSAERVLRIAENRLDRSPLFQHRPARPIRIYVCNRDWRFVLFANGRYNVGGLTYPPLSNNIFLRGVHFDANRLIGPSGNEVPGARTLSYYIAHEAVHTLVADSLGVVAHWRLPAWKNEGYADYVAKGDDFDYARVVAQFRNADRELDPARSGLYLRYHLFVAYLLDRKRISVSDLFHQQFDAARLEDEILRGESRP